MLVLHRRKEQVIRINHDIRIKVISCTSGRVRLGIEAPDEHIIWREECPKAVKGTLYSEEGSDEDVPTYPHNSSLPHLIQGRECDV